MAKITFREKSTSHFHPSKRSIFDKNNSTSSGVSSLDNFSSCVTAQEVLRAPTDKNLNKKIRSVNDAIFEKVAAKSS